MRKGHLKVDFRAMPANSRFGLFSKLTHHESSYTQEELKFRERVLAAREASGLDLDLTQTNDSWFNQDFADAFVNLNEGSWLYSEEYRPKHAINQDDFHISLISSERLKWIELSILMRTIGDYLLVRNSRLAPEHLNQPMNYVLLDVIRILKRLAMTDQADYVTKQLQLLRNYLRSIEIYVPYDEGSDRLFLAECRYTMEHSIDEELHQNIQAKRLKSLLIQVKEALDNVAVKRHALLHYAFSEEEVNPHPFWEGFAEKRELLSSNPTFPALAAKSCAQAESDAVALKGTNDRASEFETLVLTDETLSNCKDLHLIDLLSRESKLAYAQGIADLQEILRYQSLLDKLLGIFDQAGEVFTVLTLRDQVINLLVSLDKFTQRTQQTISRILDANAQIYQRFIQNQQDLAWWENWFTNRPKLIQNYITNQDNLARFKTEQSDFQLVNDVLIGQVYVVIHQLTQYGDEIKQQNLLSTTKHQVNDLMTSIHALVGHQHVLQGLPMPAQPKLLNYEEPGVIQSECKLKLSVPESSISSDTIPNPIPPSFTFWAPKIPLVTENLGINNPAIEASQSDTCQLDCSTQPCDARSQPTVDMTSMVALGVLFGIPFCLIMLKIIYDSRTTDSSCMVVSDPESYQKTKTIVEDRLARIIHVAQDLDEEDERQSLINDYQDEFNELENEAEQGIYDADEMKKLSESLKELLNNLEHEETSLSFLS
jgi:hypothetical protein